MAVDVKKNPLVSIIIPVYNGENYVADAIESALAQTYSNLEIIVVDDGSTDNTSEICKSYGDRIRYVRKKNGGVSSALNLGIKKMKGEYFSWLSHDDTYEPEKVEAQVKYLAENNYLGKDIIVFCDHYLMDKNGKRLGECKKPHLEIERKPEYALLRGHINGLALLIPKKAFLDCGDFRTDLVCVQDYEMWLRMSKKYTFKHMEATLVTTRCHSKQVSNVSPKVKTEGNKFYIDLADSISDERKIELEGSVYNFYRLFAKQYEVGVYNEFSNYCKRKMDEIYSSIKDINKVSFSIVIPFYNRIDLTLRAIQSVEDQSFKNFEVILINDGSTEDIGRIKKIVSKHDNYTLISNDSNMGPGFCRNIGIKHAKCKYIAFLDSDDCFVPEKLEKCARILLASDAKMLHTAYFMNKDNKIIEDHSVRNLDGHCDGQLIYDCRIAMPTVVLNREWILENKLFFDDKIRIGEDVVLWLKIMKTGIYLFGFDECLSTVYANSESSAYSNKKQAEGLRNIFLYTLSDDYYRDFEYENFRLLNSYVLAAKEVIGSPDYLSGHGKLWKMFYFIKTEGVFSMGKRVLNKIGRTIRG